MLVVNIRAAAANQPLAHQHAYVLLGKHSPVQMAELLARLANSGCVNQRHALIDVPQQHRVVQCLVDVLATHNIEGTGVRPQQSNILGAANASAASIKQAIGGALPQKQVWAWTMMAS
jgi:hypothetical protein